MGSYPSAMKSIVRFLVTFNMFSWGKLILPNGNDGSSKSIFNHFGSLHTLERLSHWVGKETEVYSSLKDRLSHLKMLSGMIKRYLKNYEASFREQKVKNADPTTHPGKIIGSNIVLSHVTMSRYANLMMDLRKLLNSETLSENSENIKKVLQIQEVRHTNVPWPSSEDLYLSNTALLQLQEIHGYHPEQLHIGTTIDTNFGGKLKPEHCWSIGIFALQLGFYYMAIEWLELARKQLNLGGKYDKSIEKTTVDRFLDVAIEQHNKVIKEGRYYHEDRLNTFYNLTYVGDPQNNRIRGRTIYQNEFGRTIGNGSFDGYPNMLSLCNGQEFQPQEIKKKLKCYLERSLHPYFILNPVKTEQLSDYPYIVQMYDVLGNDTIQELYKIRQEVHLSTLSTISDLKETLLHRSSAGSLIHDEEFTKKINRKSEMITGLKISQEDEPIQVVEYTYGRFCALHK